MAKQLTLQDFIEKSNKRHNNKYDYSKTVYTNSKSKLNIICPIHGEFTQTAHDHYSGCGCQKCDPTNNLTTDKFIEKARLAHGELYDYSKTIYTKNSEKVEIICSKHGNFLQQPKAHIRGQGCPSCYPMNMKSNTEEFIQKSFLKHKDLYDYSEVVYTTKREKVKIICRNHGVFEQKAYVHLQGHGCPMCQNSKLEKYLKNKLDEMDIKYEQNKRYDGCKNKLTLPFDFFITDLNLLIECDGIHHREIIKHFGGEERFLYQQNNDSIKSTYCIENDIVLIRVTSFKEIDEVIFKLTKSLF